MDARDFVYQKAHRQALDSGMSGRDAAYAAAQAVRIYRRNTTAHDAISKAIQQVKRTPR